jgi:hypothetical protein
MRSNDNNDRRFAVALSFPGEHRRFVRKVAERLGDLLGKERVFFDEWYERELRGVDADLKLKRIYRDDTDLIIPFFSEHYTKMWCQIEWRAIRTVLAERIRDDAVVPVHIDGTRIDGWETIDLGVRRGRKTGRQVADAIFDIYQQRHRLVEPTRVIGMVIPYNPSHVSTKPPSHWPFVTSLRSAFGNGDLQDSLVAPIVISALEKESDLELAIGMNTSWLIAGIRLSDEYFVRVRGSAGHRDWQWDFPLTVVPTLVGMARSLRQSADAHALIVQLCNAFAARLRVSLRWPEDPNECNDLTNDIYAACLQATDLEDEALLVALRGLIVVGPM